jgi:hypothetical protein
MAQLRSCHWVSTGLAAAFEISFRWSSACQLAACRINVWGGSAEEALACWGVFADALPRLLHLTSLSVVDFNCALDNTEYPPRHLQMIAVVLPHLTRLRSMTVQGVYLTQGVRAQTASEVAVSQQLTSNLAVLTGLEHLI